MIIKAQNNLTVNAPKTYLESPVTSNDSAFGVKNTTGFTNSWAVQVGETGQEQTEIVIGTVTDINTLSSSALSFDHPTDTPVYAIKYDQIVFERSTAGTAGTATPMTSGTVNIQADNAFTQFDDTTGSSSYAYRTYFRNSSLGVNSTESDWITSSGFSFYSLGKMRQRVKDKLVSADYLPDDSLINDWINEWLENMTNAAIAVNEDYNLGTANITVTNGIGTITSTDFKQLHRTWWVNSSGTYTARKMDSNSFSPTKIFSSVNPYFAMTGDTTFQVYPSENGTMAIEYYKLNPVLVNDTDEIPQSMKGYTNSFVSYALAQALFKDSKGDEAVQRERMAFDGLNAFRIESSPRNKTGPDTIDIVEAVTADEVWM